MQQKARSRCSSRPARCPESSERKDAFFREFLVDSRLCKSDCEDISKSTQSDEDGESSLSSVAEDFECEVACYCRPTGSDLLRRCGCEVCNVCKAVENSADTETKRTSDFESANWSFDFVEDVVGIIPASIRVQDFE